MSCNRHGPEPFVTFYGDAGTLELDYSGAFKIFDRGDKELETGPGTSQGQREHLQNFVDAIRSNNPGRLNQPALDAHRSTLLCHLGNIAYRTGRSVRCNPADGHILEDTEQQALWKREYSPQWHAAVTEI
jgi:hypothetical protein